MSHSDESSVSLEAHDYDCDSCGGTKYDYRCADSGEPDPHGGLGCRHCGLPRCRICQKEYNENSPYIMCTDIPDEREPPTTTTTATTTTTTTFTYGEPVTWSEIKKSGRCPEEEECQIEKGETWILDESMRWV